MIQCNTIPEHRPAKTDHIPIASIFDVWLQVVGKLDRRNWKNVDWITFNEKLSEAFKTIDEPKEIDDEDELWKVLEHFNTIVEKVVTEEVPLIKPSPNQHRWWTKELGAMKKVKTNLDKRSYRKRLEPDHLVHEECRRMRQTFSAELKRAKADKWVEYMANADSSSMWGIGKMVEAEPRDGGKARIPELVVKDQTGIERSCTSNQDKQKVPPAWNFAPPTNRMIATAIQRMKSGKATRPGTIPNDLF